MTQLENIFYIIGIIYMAVNIFILIGIGIGIFFIVRTVQDIHKSVMDKIKCVENAIDHPEDAFAEISMSFLRMGFRGIKKAFEREKGKKSSS